MLFVYLPGTGGMMPLPERALTGMWAEHNGKALLIDCGEGMQTALLKCKRSLARLDALLITHFHADHIAGLPGLLLSAGNYGKSTALELYAPQGAKDIIKGLCRICGALPFELNIHELSPLGESFMWNDIIVTALPVRHRIECFCYSLTEKRKPVFDPDKARRLAVPTELWKTLHSGESAVHNGRLITTDMVTSGKRQPLKVTYITDTVYFDGLIDFAARSDLLICEGMYADDAYKEKMRQKGHMVFSQAAALAAAADAGCLWLTHFSPALLSPQDNVRGAREIFSNTQAGRDGMHTAIG